MPATVALVLLSPLAATENAKQAIQTGLPRYDPGAYEKAQLEKAARAAPRNAPAPLAEAKPLPVNPAERGAPGTNPGPAAAGNGAPGQEQAASDHALALPTVTVHPNTEPPKHLPRITEHQAIHDTPAELFESPAGRDARLVRNHLSKFNQIIGRLFGSDPVARAKEMEAEKQKARQMNELAADIEIQAALGRDPEDIKKLRAEYTKLYYNGPK